MTSGKPTLSRRTTLGLAAGAAIAAPLPARAQTFPDRPVTILVPFATGGYNDRYARAIAPFLSKQLGQPVTVVNRPGGGTLLGNMFYLQQPDDGYMIMVHSAAPFIPQTILLQNAQYKAEDFWMINLPSRDATLAATASSKPINSIDEVVAALKRDPRSLTLGVQPASADFVNVALFLAGHGIDRSRTRIVTYADGGGPARTATVGGHVDVGFVGGEGFLPLKERIKPLMVFSDETNEGFPEAAVWADHAKANNIAPEFVEGSQRGFVVLRRFVERQPERYKILEAAIERTTKDPECIAAMKGQQLATTWYGPEASNRAYLNAFNTMQKYVDLLKQA